MVMHLHMPVVTYIQKIYNQGEVLKVDTGCVVAYTPSIDFDIEMVRGIKNWMFGGEGLFFAKLTGQGKDVVAVFTHKQAAGRLQQYTYHQTKKKHFRRAG